MSRTLDPLNLSDGAEMKQTYPLCKLKDEVFLYQDQVNQIFLRANPQALSAFAHKFNEDQVEEGALTASKRLLVNQR